MAASKISWTQLRRHLRPSTFGSANTWFGSERNVIRAMRTIAHFEGIRAVPYQDTEGHWTVGVGHKLADGANTTRRRAPNIVAGLYQQDFLQFAGFISDEHRGLFSDGPRLCALTSLAFNVGRQGYLGFANMRTAIDERDWRSAAAELVDSVYAGLPGERGVGRRAWITGAMLRLGQWWPGI